MCTCKYIKYTSFFYNSKCLKGCDGHNLKTLLLYSEWESPIVKGDSHSVKHVSAEQFPFDGLSTQIPSYTQMPDSPL